MVVLLEPVKQEILSLNFKVSVARFVFLQSIETVDSGTYLEGLPENAKVSWLLRRGSRYGALGVKIFDGWSSHCT